MLFSCKAKNLSQTDHATEDNPARDEAGQVGAGPSRSPFMRGLLVFAIVAIALPAGAQVKETYQDLGQVGGNAVDVNVDRPLAYSRKQEPAWVAAAVKDALRQIKVTRRGEVQHMLFKYKGKPGFLAVTWQGGLFEGAFGLFRVTPGKPKPKLTILSNLHSGWYSILEPSGMDVYPDHLAPLFVKIAKGGSSWLGYGMMIARLGEHAEDVTPPLRTVWAGDVEGDGVVQVLSSDDRWGNFFRGCGQCGPLFPVVWLWRGDAYGPACRERPRAIQERLQWYEDNVGTFDPKTELLVIVESRIQAAMLLLQLGEPEQARSRYAQALTLLRTAAGAGGAKAGEWQEWLASVEESFGPAIEQAAAAKDSPCPLLAVKSRGAHPGAVKRSDSYR